MAITTFIPKVWSARLVKNLDKNHVFANLVDRSYEGEIKNFGDTVHINTLSNVAIKDYAKNGSIASPDQLTTTEELLVIDKAKYFNFAIDDIDAAQARTGLIDKAMGRASYGLADASDAYLAEIIGKGAGSAVGSKTSPKSLTASTIYDFIVDMKTAMDEKNVPTIGRKLAVTPAEHALLLKDTAHFVSASATNDVVAEGAVGKVAGFDVYVSNNIYKDTTNNCFYVPAWVEEAAVFAEQVLKMEAYRPDDTFADAVKGLYAFGAKVVSADRICVMYANV